MKIILASDENYFMYIYISVLTLFESNRSQEYSVTYIYQDVGRDKIRYLTELGERYGRAVEVAEFVMPKEYEALPSFASSKTTYAKFLFASMFPNDDEVLYLDPDTLVMAPLDLLISIDMGDNLIAGVTECLPYYHKDASKMQESDQYINGGMVLCNLKKWREESFEKRALERLKDTRKNLNYDQGILNELCSGRIKILPPKYNVLAEVFEFRSSEKIKKRYGFKEYYSQEDIDEALVNPAIIHFTGFLYGKPISRKCTHPYASFFREKIKECPWDVKLTDRDIDIKRRIRKWTLHHMPFLFYLFLEDILDIRRKWNLTRG